MTRDELVTKLTELNVNSSSYSLDGLRGNDRLCVVHEESSWGIYYVERDRPEQLAEFPSESDAFDFMFLKFSELRSY
jgi:hypothetical protein